ncbi:hypothetical protein JCM9279_003828 [Rhodotorula babjevae]
MSLAAQEPAFMRAVREQARKLASLHLYPTPPRTNPKPAQVKPPTPGPARSAPRLAAAPALVRPARTFSTTTTTSKALAHVVSTGNEQAGLHPPPTASRFSPAGATAAHAHEPRSAGAQAVVKGQRKGRTLKSLSLENKLCVVFHPDSSIALTLAATFLEAGANDIVFAVREPAAPAAGPSAPLDPLAASPVGQLRKLAAERGYPRDRLVEVTVAHDASEHDAARTVLGAIGRTFGSQRQVDVLCCGPPRNDDDATASVPLLRTFAEAMATQPASGAFDRPERSASVILLSAPYGPRVDLPQPQPLGEAVGAAEDSLRRAGAAEMSRLSKVLGAEFAARHVRFNTISPGFMRTPEVVNMLERDPSLARTWQEATPLGRVGGVEELKGAAVLFASDASRFTTGTTVVVDGGFSLV